MIQPLPIISGLPVSRYRCIDPDTGWVEVYEREWREGGWTMVATYPLPADEQERSVIGQDRPG